MDMARVGGDYPAHPLSDSLDSHAHPNPRLKYPSRFRSGGHPPNPGSRPWPGVGAYGVTIGGLRADFRVHRQRIDSSEAGSRQVVPGPRKMQAQRPIGLKKPELGLDFRVPSSKLTGPLGRPFPGSSVGRAGGC